MTGSNAEQMRRIRRLRRSWPTKHDYSIPPIDRLLAQVEFDTNGGCWLWSGPAGTGRSHELRARFMTDKSRDDLAYRASYRLLVGEIPDGMAICHKCDQPLCVNPVHLFVGTQAENVADMWGKGRGNKHGLRAHPKGSAHPGAKLTEDDVRAIRADPRNGVEVGAAYGVTKTTVSYIRARKTWGHVK